MQRLPPQLQPSSRGRGLHLVKLPQLPRRRTVAVHPPFLTAGAGRGDAAVGMDRTTVQCIHTRGKQGHVLVHFIGHLHKWSRVRARPMPRHWPTPDPNVPPQAHAAQSARTAVSTAAAIDPEGASKTNTSSSARARTRSTIPMVPARPVAWDSDRDGFSPSAASAAASTAACAARGASVCDGGTWATRYARSACGARPGGRIQSVPHTGSS